MSQAGVQKSSPAQRRHSVGGVIGDKVIIPGSPATTLPELLKEAEVSVRLEEDVFHSSFRSSDVLIPPKTPVPIISSISTTRPSLSKVQQTLRKLVGPRGWTKDDWKLLDSCYTDERLARTRSPEALVPAESVDLENVVNRFINEMGGPDTIKTLGPLWSRYIFIVQFASNTALMR